MGLEYYICLITIKSQRFHDILCPCVSVTHLINSISHFKKAINMIQLCISPKAGIRCIRRSKQTFGRILKLRSIFKIQQCINFLICINRILGSRFAFRC